MKTKNLAELCDLAPLDWDAASASLPEAQAADADGGPGRYTAWLTTINADGSPHVTGVGARWDDRVLDRVGPYRTQGPKPRA